MSARRLVTTWGLLMGLTLLAGLAAGVSGTVRPGTAGLIALAGVTIVKARLILQRYLRLEAAPPFLSGFTAAVVIVLSLVTLSFVVPLERPKTTSPVRAHAASERNGNTHGSGTA